MYNPTDLYKELYENASTRKKRTLEIINRACDAQSKSSMKDFSLPTIAKIIAPEGGPTEQALRNKNGTDYRNLIACWANYTQSSMKKPSKQPSNIYDELLSNIEDATTKALVGILIAENKKLKAENILLKKESNFTIDMRKDNSAKDSVVIMPSPYDFSDSEINALKSAISGDFFAEQGWTVDEVGRVKDGNYTLYKVGYVNAIRKILEHT